MRAQSLIRSLRTIPPQRSLPRTLLVRHPQAIATVPTSRLYSTPPTSEAADKSEDASAVDEEDLSKKLASVEEVRDQLEKKTEELQTKVAGLEVGHQSPSTKIASKLIIPCRRTNCTNEQRSRLWSEE